MKNATLFNRLGRAAVASFCIATLLLPPPARPCAGSRLPACALSPTACLKSMSLAKSAPTGMGLIALPGGMATLTFTLTAICPSCPTTPCATPATPTAATATVAFYPGAAGPCPPGPPAGAPAFPAFTTAVALPACTAAGAFTTYTISVPIPATAPLGIYCVYGIISVTFSDGMTLSASGDTKVCIVEPAPGQSGVPRLSLTLLSESAPRRAPGDVAVARYSVRNNDPSNAVTLTAIAGSRQSAVRPQGGNERQGVFAISNPYGDDFPIVFNPGANCIPLPDHPYTQAPISNPLPTLGPGQSNVITVGIRSYGQCGNGSCSEGTLVVTGNFSDNSPAMACAGMALIVDTSVPSTPCARAVNDCNQNGIPDALDIAAGRSQDRNYNAMPDECEEFITVPISTSVSPTNPPPGAPIFVQIFFNEVVPMATVWANGSPLVRTQLFGLPFWQGTIPADTRPGPQTVYFAGKDQVGSMALAIATYQVAQPSITVPVLAGFSTIADNLLATPNNNLTTVMPNPAEDTQIYKWNRSTQNYDVFLFIAGIWIDGTSGNPGDTTLLPGEGAWIFSPAPQTFVFRGTAGPSGAQPRLAPGLHFVSCRTPQACTFEEMMGFPPVVGDRVLKHDHTTPGLSPEPSSTHVFTATGWSPSAPVLAVAKAAFVELVAPNTPPTITCPEFVAASCSGSQGTPISFTTSAVDNRGSNVTVTCAPPSGSSFPVGTTTVNCSATDASGNTNSCSFTATVVDTTPPAITCPSAMTAECVNPDGAVASFNASVTDNCDSSVTVQCTPPSGSTFPFGRTTVTCNATDASGNASSCSFTVTVSDNTPARLAIERQGASVVISWPAACRPYILQTAASLTGLIHWLDVTNPPTLNNGRFILPQSIVGGRNAFYRLSSRQRLVIIPPPQGNNLNGQASPIVPLGVQLVDFSAARVQFEFTQNGNDFFVIGIDSNPADGFSANWPVQTMPPGDYTLRVTAFDTGGLTLTSSMGFTVHSTLPAPHFVSPVPFQEISSDIMLQVSQDAGTAGWASVRFEVGTDGINFQHIATDSDGSDGFTALWDISGFPPAGYILRATATDLDDNSAASIIHVGRVDRSNFLDGLPIGPVELTTFLGPDGPVTLAPTGATPIRVLRGVFVVGIQANLLTPPPPGAMRATLLLDRLEDNEQTFSTDVEVLPGNQASLAVGGLDPGTYRAVVMVTYLAGEQIVDLRSPVVMLNVAEADPINSGNPILAQTLLDDLMRAGVVNGGSAQVAMRQRGLDVGAVAGVRSQTAAGMTLLLENIARGAGMTTVMLQAVNETPGQVNDILSFSSVAFNSQGQPSIGTPQQVAVSLPPFGSQSVTYEVAGSWGAPAEFAGFQASLHSSGAFLEGFGVAVHGSEVEIIGSIGVELGLGFVSFNVNANLDFKFDTRFSEYHWQRCHRVTNVLPAGADPNATYTWKVVNSDGSTWGARGKELAKHAAILGGPHKVRVVCVSGDGTTVTYGSDHYVHQRETGAKVTDAKTTTEYECGRTLVGPSGPGGKITYMQGISVTHEVSITSTISGTVGKEGVASIGGSIGATAGQSVTKSESAEYEHDIKEGKCGVLKERLCFKVTRGKITKTFSDGTSVTGDFEAKVLTSVGYKYEEVNCP